MSDGGLVDQIGKRMARRLVLANLDGALIALVAGAISFPAPPHDVVGGLSVYDFMLFGFMVLVGTPVAAGMCALLYKRSCRWITEGRDPSPQERARTLAIPQHEAVLSFGFWLLGASLYGGGSLFQHDATWALRLFLTVAMGGLTTSAVAFLLIERTLRPVFGLTLATGPAASPSKLSVTLRMLLSWEAGSAVPLLMIGLLFLGPASGRTPHPAAAVWFLVVVGLLVGSFITWVAARSVADPLDDMRDAVERVQRDDLDISLAVNDASEIGLLESGLNRMVAGLRERRRLQDLFGRQVGTEVARQALASDVALGGERREVSVLFVDVIASTKLAQREPPEAVVNALNDFFDAVVRAVGAEGGWVNKFQGDGALCVFGAPAPQRDHATRALRAARTLRRELLALAATRPGFEAGIGVSSGTVVAGNVGTERRYEYTVIGDPVNEACRLSDEAKLRMGRVLASDETIARADGQSDDWIVADELFLRGRSVATLAYEPSASER